MNKKIRFIDLFAGIGGFHQALIQLNGECVFASEIDPYCIETYKENYGIDANHDITTFPVDQIPTHDFLCAGFPCQTFSKAGNQNGFSETRGTLFYNILEILDYHRPQYLLLENVRNLVTHDSGHTWKTIKKSLKSLGYRLTDDPLLLSPHQIGIPQLRERVFILGVLDPENTNVPLTIKLPHLLKKSENSIDEILNGSNREYSLKITDYEKLVLNAWNNFYQGIDIKTIGFPIWTEYFGRNISDYTHYPKWKQIFISKNINLYNKNKKFIDQWLTDNNYLRNFKPTDRKFEWQAGTDINNIWQGIIQFRPSGIRVKRPDTFPTLVAMVHTPIIGKYKRRLSVEETLKLQSFPTSFKLNKNKFQSYKQLGNSVNVEVVKMVAKILLELN